MALDDFTLWDERGARLYLTPEERDTFRAAARAQDDTRTRTFCQLLYYTGCRMLGTDAATLRLVGEDRRPTNAQEEKEESAQGLPALPRP